MNIWATSVLWLTIIPLIHTCAIPTKPNEAWHLTIWGNWVNSFLGVGRWSHAATHGAAERIFYPESEELCGEAAMTWTNTATLHKSSGLSGSPFTFHKMRQYCQMVSKTPSSSNYSVSTKRRSQTHHPEKLLSFTNDDRCEPRHQCTVPNPRDPPWSLWVKPSLY